MVVSYPGGCAYGTGDDDNVCDNANNEDGNEDGVVIYRMVPECVHNLEDKPPNSRQCATAVNAP